ncbi:uncharacterized protein [Nicotiana tomentosiformis]|uniref:uncharacterized protein n=1 Tax=Nicotiana tomentosiformis TaxID=4098 RepID=UPI00388C6628
MVAFSQATETRKLKNRMERQSSCKARSASNFGGSFGGSGCRSAFRGASLGPFQSFAQSLKGEQSSGTSQGSRGTHQQGQPDRRFQQRRLPFPKCGRMHFGSCFMDLPVFYECGLRGHILRDCHSSRRNMGRGAAQPANSVATTSTTPPARGTPAPVGRGIARGGAQNLGGPNRFYAMRRRRESEASPDVVTDGEDMCDRIRRMARAAPVEPLVALAEEQANVVADALSRKAESMGSLAYLPVAERQLATDVQALANQFVRLDVSEASCVLACVVAQSSLFEHIKARQFDDSHLLVLKDTVQRGGAKEVLVDDDGVMRLLNWICVPNVDGLRDLIL